MTQSQRKYFYFPAWRRCAGALRWVMVNGRLDADLADQVEEAQLYQRIQHHSPSWDERIQVIDTAENLALQHHRAVTAEDLRHACTWLITRGRTIESGKLNQAEISRTVALFNLLCEPDSLSAIDTWLNPEDAERRDFARFLEGQPAPILSAIREIARNRWDTSGWNLRPLNDLKWIWTQVRDRRARTTTTQRHASCPF